jgi:hypothetical protein
MIFCNGAKTEFDVCTVRNGLSFLEYVNSLCVVAILLRSDV